MPAPSRSGLAVAGSVGVDSTSGDALAVGSGPAGVVGVGIVAGLVAHAARVPLTSHESVTKIERCLVCMPERGRRQAQVIRQHEGTAEQEGNREPVLSAPNWHPRAARRGNKARTGDQPPHMNVKSPRLGLIGQ
jgi:hypothetical protein